MELPYYTVCEVTATILAWCGAGLTVLAHLVYLISFGLPVWGQLTMQQASAETGLWQECYYGLKGDGLRNCVSLSSYELPGFLMASRVFYGMAFVTCLLQTTAVLLYLYVKKLGQDKRMVLLTTLACAINVVLLMMTLVTYGSGFNTDHAGGGYAYRLAHGFGLAAFSLIIYAATLAIYLLELFKAKFTIPA